MSRESEEQDLESLPVAKRRGFAPSSNSRAIRLRQPSRLCHRTKRRCPQVRQDLPPTLTEIELRPVFCFRCRLLPLPFAELASAPLHGFVAVCRIRACRLEFRRFRPSRLAERDGIDLLVVRQATLAVLPPMIGQDHATIVTRQGHRALAHC